MSPRKKKSFLIIIDPDGSKVKDLLKGSGTAAPEPEARKRSWSPLQEKHLAHFESAKEYARHVAATPELAETYKLRFRAWKKRTRATHVGIPQMAISDYCNPPVINKLEFMRAFTIPKSILRCTATANVLIVGARITLRLPSGVITEEQEFGSDGKRTLWIDYTFREPGMIVPGSTAEFRVWDLPGHITEKILTFTAEMLQ